MQEINMLTNQRAESLLRAINKQNSIYLQKCYGPPLNAFFANCSAKTHFQIHAIVLLSTCYTKYLEKQSSDVFYDIIRNW